MSGATQYPMYRPLTIGEILNRIYRLLRANLKLLIGIGAVPAAATFITFGALFAAAGIVIFAAVQGGKPPSAPHVVVASFAAFLAMLLVHLSVIAVYLAAASYAAVLADCGIRVTIGESYGVAWLRAGHYILLILSMYAVCFLPTLLLELPMFGMVALFASNKTMPPPALIFLVPLDWFLCFGAGIAGVLVALRFSLAFPASVFESLRVREALKRSWRLTRGALGRIFLVVLAIYAATYVAMMVVMCTAMSAGAIVYLVFSGTRSQPSTHAIWFLAVCAAIAYLVLISVFTACSWAGFSTAFAVFYNDQRMRIDSPPASTSPTGVPA